MIEAETVSDASSPDDAPAARGDDALARGTTLGRYIVIEGLGSGGMGVVYAAYDPELDRKVALKLLRDSTGGPGRRARLKREAQALAKLDHPNIVPVHDVGEIDEHLFIAMELVVGQTVTAWIAEQPRDWRGIVDVYRLAGAGLAAAHSVGIVHRDFKPDNVLIGSGERVRVVDFGLAVITQDVDAVDASASSRELAEAAHTRTGALLGTPGYIAPEQLDGKAQPSSDQFSFCVALWRGLHGELPFAGRTAGELVEAARRGDLRTPKQRIPARLHGAIRRGLSADPTQRFPTMTDLLAALRPPPARGRVAIAAGIAIPVVALVAYAVTANRGPTPCRGADRALAGAWDRDAIARVFGHTNVPYASATAASVTAQLESYASAWTAMRTDACEATRVRGEQSEELLDLRIACLDRHGRELRALGDVFAHADAKVVERAVQATQGLSPLAECADTAGLTAPVKPPENVFVRGQIDQLFGDLAEAKTLDRAGKYDDAIARAQKIVDEAHVLAYRPLEARSLHILGMAQAHLAKPDAAEPTLESAVNAAIAAHDDATATAAGTELIKLIGYDKAKVVDAERWIARTRSFLEARPDDHLELDLENAIGNVRMEGSKFDEAVVHHERALALSTKLFGPDSAVAGITLDNLGNDYAMKGKASQASDYHRRALALEEVAFGPTHPRVALTLTNLAGTLEDENKLDEAKTAIERAIAIKTAVYGAESMMVGASLHELGNVYELKGDADKAVEIFGHVVAIYRKELPADHPRLGNAVSSLASALLAAHRFDEADGYARESLAIRMKSLGPDSRDLGTSYIDLGHVAIAREHWDDAIAWFGKALAVYEKTVDKDSPRIAEAQADLAEAHLDAGHVQQALDLFARAMPVRDSDPDPADRAHTYFAYARALWEHGEHDRGRDKADQARKLAGEAGAAGRDLASRIDAWLAAHR